MSDAADCLDTIHGRVIALARARPDAVALRQGSEVLTYGDLVLAAKHVGSELLRRGVRPGDLVLVRGERSLSLVAALLGVLVAGGAYVAADRRWPPHTLHRVARHVRFVVEIGAVESAGLPHAPVIVEVEAAELLRRARESVGVSAPAWPEVRGADPCSVFFTSGTTGDPKGVLALHRGTVGRFCDVGYAPFDADTVTLQALPLPWDGLTFELWSSVLNGGVAILHDGGTLNPPAVRAARRAGVNTLWLTSPLFAGIVEDDVGCFSGYRLVLTGGDRTSPEHVRTFLDHHPDVILLHAYGPAEATVFTTSYIPTSADMVGREDVPLGWPLPATTVALLDDHLAPVPDGEIGEICVGGIGLASGYLGDDDLTARRFVKIDGERVYRTGDQGWRDTDGLLHFAGRRDRQIKVRGNRIELGEIEAAVRALPDIVEARATVTGDVGRERLAVHYTTRGGTALAGAVAAACRERLPHYAVPSRVVHHARLPLTAHGKIDVEALTHGDDTADADRSSDRDLGLLQELVAPVLGRRPDPSEDLVAGGLDSLSAMRVAYRASAAFNVDIGVGDLYIARRLDRLAATLANLRPTAEADACRGPADGGRADADAKDLTDGGVTGEGGIDGTELTGGELEWWLRDQLFPGEPASLVLSVFDVVGGEVDAERLRRAARRLADRHEVLRSHVTVTAGGPRLAVLPPGTVAPVTVLAAPPDAPLPAGLLAPFDLERVPAWRLGLLRHRGGQSAIALVAHHRLVDGWSERVLVEELGAAWRAEEPGSAVDDSQSSAIPVRRRRRVPNGTGSEDGAAWWAEQLRPAEPLDLAPRAPEATQGLHGRWAIDFREVVGAAKACPEAMRALANRPPGELLQARLVAAVAHALRADRSAGPVCVGVTYAGRDLVSEDELGCVVETLPLAVPVDTDPVTSCSEVARRWLGALEHRDIALPVRLARARRDRSGAVLQVVFAVQSNLVVALDLGSPWRTIRRETDPLEPLHPIDIEVFLGDRPRLQFTWDRRLVDPDWASGVLERLVAVLPELGLSGEAL